MARTAGAGVRRVLFLPVSGTYGMGEYARSLSIARAAAARWPVEAHFVLSRTAPYAAGTPFPHTLLPASPTFHSSEVIELIETWRPHAVVFDNAGRTAQLRAAQRCGARVIYISARTRQRRKAFRLRWMRLIDEHWIAYPAFIAGGLRPLERFKLRVLRRPLLRFLDVLVAPEDAARRAALLAQWGCAERSYVLVVPGGGTGHPGVADATAVFRAASATLAAAVPVLFVGPAAAQGQDPHTHGSAAVRGEINAPLAALRRADAGVDVAAGMSPAGLRQLGALPQPDLVELMRGAHLVMTNGGSTLMQALACGVACVGVAIAKDQAERLRHCVRAGAAVAASLDVADMARTTGELLRDEARRSALAQAARRLAPADGMDQALGALARLLELE